MPESAGAVYLDYFTALADGRSFKRELTVDGLMPNAAGYAVMAPLAEAAIAEALKKSMPECAQSHCSRSPRVGPTHASQARPGC